VRACRNFVLLLRNFVEGDRGGDEGEEVREEQGSGGGSSFWLHFHSE